MLAVVGTRPQFVKSAAIARAEAEWNRLHPGSSIGMRLLHTGQHYDDELSGIFFRELQLPQPDFELKVGSATHGVQTGRMLEGLESVMLRERPDVVVLFGDTNSTLAGALAAAKLGIPLAHVEAGLRSHRRGMAEEINRVVTDHVATLHFCPSDSSVINLRAEGIVDGVHKVGDVMFDVLLHELPAERERSRLLSSLGIDARGFALATVHRAENTDDVDRLRTIVAALELVASRGMQVVFPIHPRTSEALGDVSLPPMVRLVPPVSYRQMLALEASARAILTDSGGVQKEAYWLGVPCVTLREETEWVETVQLGWNVVTACRPEVVAAAALAEPPIGRRPSVYGDGRAAAQIVDILASSIEPGDLPPAERASRGVRSLPAVKSMTDGEREA